MECPLGADANLYVKAPRDTWSEWKNDAREAEEMFRKTTPLTPAGRPVPCLQQVTDNVAGMRVVQGIGALIESEISARTADITFAYSALDLMP